MPETHQTTGYYGITGDMNIRQILADNLATLQSSRKDLKSAPAIERATTTLGPGKRVSKTAVQQLQKASTPFNLDDLQTLAEVFGLDAWQLLVPGIDPKSPPVVQSIGPTEDELYKRIRSAREALNEVLGDK